MFSVTESSGKGKYIKGIIIVLFLVLFYITIHNLANHLYFISGQSMYPTLENEEVIWSELNDFDKYNIWIGDIIVIKLEDNLKVIKRVVAKEGDIVELREGLLYVNGQLIQENYVNEWDAGYRPADYAPRKIQEGYVFVLGDNRMHSSDSRSYGAIEYEKIQAKALKVIYPFKKQRELR